MADDKKDILSDPNGDPALAEAIARRDESRAHVFNARVNRLGGAAVERLASALGEMADKAGDDASRSSAALADIEPARPDPEGTARPLADSKGNFAANAEVAAVGGTGIKASNSVGDSDTPATTQEEAGYPIVEGAQKIVVDQPVGERATAEDVEEPRKRGRSKKNDD